MQNNLRDKHMVHNLLLFYTAQRRRVFIHYSTNATILQ